MSPATLTASDAQFVEGAVPLLKEYTEKLRALSDEADRFYFSIPRPAPSGSVLTEQAVTTRGELARRWKHLKSPAQELARQASGVVEEGNVSGLEKIQLWLRLSEFEHALATAEEAIARMASVKDRL
jgi:hypothetical protein